jgi:non-specific serine/threonine protein kinase
MYSDLKIIQTGLDEQNINSRSAQKESSRIKRILFVSGILFLFIFSIIWLYVFWPTYENFGQDRIMLAVLPFENLGSPEDEYFSEGISEEIMFRLSTIHGLGVVSRQSVLRYKNREKTIQEMGKELGVDYLVDGSIRYQHLITEPNRVRVISNLINVSNLIQISLGNYEESLTDIFNVQSKIAEEVAKALEIRLLEPERRSLESKSTENLQAYEYYLRGNDYWVRDFEIESVESAIQMYEKAIELDPQFVLAFAKLARSYGWKYMSFGNQEKDLSNSKKYLDRVLNLKQKWPGLNIHYHRLKIIVILLAWY